MRGKFITLEGMDGAGKSSHIGTIRATLSSRGVDALFTREPGGTELGERLRELVLHEKMSLKAETLMIFAARAEHIVRVIEPALDAGTWVVSDRFTDATYAYQGCGRGLGTAAVEQLERWVQNGLQPDLTLLFDVPVGVGLARRKQASLDLDRFEQEDRAFFERVREGYFAQPRKAPERIRIIDASRPAAEVQRAVEQALLRMELT
jgi:dTMP kinase